MKAAQINNYGDVTAIKVRDIDEPVITAEQVLVETSAAALNPFDLAVLAGHAQSMAPLNFPATLGIDLAGTVLAVGDNVTGFTVGDRVYGTANAMFGASGAFAEQAAVNADSLAHSPADIEDVAAASLPTAGISALQAVNSMNVQPGQKVFIHGASGGVGAIAVQIAKSRGAYVAATVSTDNVDFVKSLGADEIIDYKTQNYKETVKDFDALLNNVRTNDINPLLDTLQKGGVAISLVGPFDEQKIEKLGLTAIAQMTRVNTKALDELRELVDQGSVKPTVAKIFSLDQIRDAYTALAAESIKGKIVVTVR